MKTVLISDIQIGERFRKVYANIPQLAESIKSKGLIHPLVVDSSLKLVVGGRRLQAAKVAGITEVDVIIRDNLSELELRELELEENIQRDDLTWQEETDLVEEIDRLKKQRYGDKEADRSSVGWSMRDTARLLDESVGSVSQDIALAKARKLIPALNQAKTKSEAQKMLKSILADAATKELVNRAKKETKTVESAGKDYLIGDGIEGLRKLTPGVVGFADVDPDWGVGIWTDQKAKKGTGGYHSVSAADYPNMVRTTAKELYRVLRPDSFVIWWFATSMLEDTVTSIRGTGFKFDSIPGIWFKGEGYGNPTQIPDLLLKRQYETFLIMWKGNPVIVKKNRGNVFTYPAGQHTDHPAAKPVELMRDIISTFTSPGVMAVIPFLGSGNTLRALYSLGSKGLGWDLNEDYKIRFLANVLADKEEGKYLVGD